MRFAISLATSVAFTLPFAAVAFSATVTGQVKGPDGKPAMGAFVVAVDPQKHMSVYVLSDAQGRYRIPNLPAATYTIEISATGYKSAPRPNVALTKDQQASFDFTLQKTPVLWSQISTYQGRILLPKIAGHDLSHKDRFFLTCMESCHSFEHQMATKTLDKAGWLSLVDYMRSVMPIRPTSDKQADDFASYLAVLFGPHSPKPASPDQMPAYKSLLRPVTPQALNIVYVEYDFPAPSGIGPWSAAPDKNGMLWIPYYGRGDEVVRLNPKTGRMTPFPLPASTDKEAAGIHSAVPARDGTVWFSELGRGRIGHLDPATKKITEYQNTALPNGRRTTAHTVLVDPSGHVWASGGQAITMFDPATIEFKHWPLAGTYGVINGENGDVWFTDFVVDGPIVRISKDGKPTKFYPPTKGKPQRLEMDSDGNIWFTERQGNKIGRLDPKTGSFKEYPLPGPEASPYAIGVDRNHMVWYSSHEQDTFNRLDPKTGQVTEYPYPHSEISMRDLFTDAQGRIWYASSVNNKVGYFYLAGQGGASPTN